MSKYKCVASLLMVLSAAAVVQTQPDARQVSRARRQAEAEVPRLVEVLELKPGMVVADVGAGGGAMTVVLGTWLTPAGRVFATDIGARQLATIREYAKSEGLANVTVLEGAEASTNLPPACCDAIFMRDVYHHITQPEAFNKSLAAALKAGGRLAVIDFLARPGSRLSGGVNPNRGGHGILPAIVVSEVSEAGLTHVETADHWPNDGAGLFLVLFRKG